MPKGEHFKKNNPRNYQVSFKVNEIELDKLKALASDKSLSVPEWLRSHIVFDGNKSPQHNPKPIKKVVKKVNPISSSDTQKGEQTSLF